MFPFMLESCFLTRLLWSYAVRASWEWSRVDDGGVSYIQVLPVGTAPLTLACSFAISEALEKVIILRKALKPLCNNPASKNIQDLRLSSCRIPENCATSDLAL